MEISFKKALIAPFSDENWLSKVGIGVALFIPALMASLAFGEKNWTVALLSFIAAFFMGGYSWVVMHNEINNIENELPSWDVIKIAYLALQGLVISLGYVLISVPIILVFTALMFSSKSLLVIFATIGAIIAILWYLILLPIAQTLFAKDFEITEAFNFQKVIAIVKNSWKYYLLAIFYSFLIAIIFAFSFGILSAIIGVFNKSLAEFIMQISQILIIIANANLYGQTFKKATENIEKNNLAV